MALKKRDSHGLHAWLACSGGCMAHHHVCLAGSLAHILYPVKKLQGNRLLLLVCFRDSKQAVNFSVGTGVAGWLSFIETNFACPVLFLAGWDLIFAFHSKTPASEIKRAYTELQCISLQYKIRSTEAIKVTTRLRREPRLIGNIYLLEAGVHFTQM